MPKAKNRKEIEESLLVRAFAEIMPEVKFIDVTTKAGGDIAGGARRQLEKRLGKSIVSKKNYLKKPPRKKLLGE